MGLTGVAELSPELLYPIAITSPAPLLAPILRLSAFDEHNLRLVRHTGDASLDVLLVPKVATLQRRDCVLLRDNLEVVVELVHEGGA